MEDSRKGKKDDEKGLSTPSPHVDKEKGKEAMVYKTKKGKRRGEEKSSSKIIALGHIRGDSWDKLHLLLQSLYAKTQYLGSRSD